MVFLNGAILCHFPWIPKRICNPSGLLPWEGRCWERWWEVKPLLLRSSLTLQLWSRSYGSVFVLVTGTWLSFLFGEH